MSDRFPRINLADVEEVERQVILHGLFYRGLNNRIFGPTGSGKTLVATRLLLEALRSGETVAHLDMEIGGPGSKASYVAHGAKPDELARIHYVEMPNPRLEEAQEFTDAILASGETVALFDKKPDFLRSMKLGENSNDDQSEFYGSLIDPLRERVTTIVLSPTGHTGEFDKGSRARGGSEADFKYDAVWGLSTSQEFDRNRIGRVQLRCTKDRWGLIGRGRVVEFDIGGDGKGGIVFREASSGFETEAESAANSFEDQLRASAVEAGRQIARDAAAPMKGYLDWFKTNLGPENTKNGTREQRIAAVKAASRLPVEEVGLTAVKSGRQAGRHGEVDDYQFREAQS